MRIYTRTGDDGQTGVIGGRLSKDDIRVEAYGTVDEANCFLGQAVSMLDSQRDADIIAILVQIQHELFDCGFDLALMRSTEKGRAAVDRKGPPSAGSEPTSGSAQTVGIEQPSGADRTAALPYRVNADMVKQLEVWIDKYDAETPEITRFILPGGSQAAALLHVCRTVTRRAERWVVSLAKTEPVNPEVRRYLNRLSDLFFTVARAVNVRENVVDVAYERSGNVFRKE